MITKPEVFREVFMDEILLKFLKEGIYNSACLLYEKSQPQQQNQEEQNAPAPAASYLYFLLKLW